MNFINNAMVSTYHHAKADPRQKVHQIRGNWAAWKKKSPAVLVVSKQYACVGKNNKEENEYAKINFAQSKIMQRK